MYHIVSNTYDGILLIDNQPCYFRIQTHAEVFGLMLKDKLPKLAAHLVSCILLSYPLFHYNIMTCAFISTILYILSFLGAHYIHHTYGVLRN